MAAGAGRPRQFCFLFFLCLKHWRYFGVSSAENNGRDNSSLAGNLGAGRLDNNQSTTLPELLPSPDDRGWGIWRLWAECEGGDCATGTPGRELWQRLCLDRPPSASCDGRSIDVKLRSCRNPTCTSSSSTSSTTSSSPVGCPLESELQDECRWGEWSPWTNCSGGCNVFGSSSRSRAKEPMFNLTFCHLIKETQMSVCGGDSCPEWDQWGPWSACMPLCGDNPYDGRHTRRRFCRGKGAGLDCDYLSSNCSSLENCTRLSEECRVSDRRACFKEPIIELPSEAEEIVKEIANTIKYAFTATGSFILIGVCLFEIVIYLRMKQYSIHRSYHLVEEVSLIISHLCLIVMEYAGDHDISCYAMIAVVNGAYLSFFSSVCLECIHVMFYVGHIIRRHSPLNYVLRFGLGVALPCMISGYMLWGFGDSMICPGKNGKRLCWIRFCAGGVSYTSDCTQVWPGRVFFILYFTLFGASFVFWECGKSLRVFYPHRLPQTDRAVLSDSEFAYSGLALKLLLSYTAFTLTLFAVYTQTTSPDSPAILVLNTVSLVVNGCLAANLLFYHSFGNSLVRKTVKNIGRSIRDFFCCKKNQKSETPNRPATTPSINSDKSDASMTIESPDNDTAESPDNVAESPNNSDGKRETSPIVRKQQFSSNKRAIESDFTIP